MTTIKNQAIQIENVDRDYLVTRFESASRWVAEYIQDISTDPEPKKLQWIYSKLGRNYLTLGCCYFAVGMTENAVASFHNSAQSWLSVFKLRGKGFIRVAKPSQPEIGHQGLPPESSYKKVVDYSMTNSNDNRLATHLALICNDLSLATDISSRAWDPDNSYVHPKSQVCTNNEQHLAYALKDLLRNDTDEAFGELKRLSFRIRPDHKFEYQLLRAIIFTESETFGEILAEYLQWHKAYRKRKSNSHIIYHMACLPAVALSRLALVRNLVRMDELPLTNLSMQLLSNIPQDGK